MSASGANQLLVEQDGELLVYTGQRLTIADGNAVVLLGVPGRGKPTLAPNSHGAILEVVKPELNTLTSLPTGLTYWKWSPWGDPKDGDGLALNRRIGLFKARLATPVQVELVAYVHSARLLTTSQSMQLIKTISEQFPGAIWDYLDKNQDTLARPYASSDQSARSPRRQSVSLLDKIEHELRAARSAAEKPAWELAPSHPSREPAPGQPTRGRYFDIPENRVIVAWARMRLSQIEALLRQIDVAIERLDAAFGEDLRILTERAAAAGRTAESDVLEDRTRLPTLRARLLAKRPAIDRILRNLLARGIGERWSMSPAIRRNPGLALLASAQARPFLDESCSELRDVGFAVLPLRTSSRLYELWAALAVARALHEIGFRQSSPLLVNDHGAHENLFELPHRVAWTFTREDTRLYWSFSPPVTTLDGDLQPSEAGLLLTRQERTLCRVGPQPIFDTYVTGLHTNNPDYIVRVERQGRTAFAVGDAIFGDPHHPKGIRHKLGKVAGEYADNILYLDSQGRPRTCHLGSSFVLIPCAPDDPSELEKSAAERQIVLLPLAPGPNGHPSPAATHQITQIVDTLLWLCDHPDISPNAT